MTRGTPRPGWVTLVAALLVLDASLAFQNAWPTPGIRWHGTLSIELVAFILVLLAATRRLGSPRPKIRRWLAASWLVLALSHYAEVTSWALYGRELNLYWDLRFLPAVGALLARPERWWVVVLAILGVVLVLGVLYTLLRWAIGRVSDAVTNRRERRVLMVLAAVAMMLLVAQPIDPFREWTRFDGSLFGTALFSNPVLGSYAHQARLTAATLRRSTTIPASPSMNSDLSLLRGADVLVVFIEAYGAVSYQRPEFAERLAVPRVQFEAAIHDTHRNVVSAYVESPTFGGSSWLAHISLLSGVEVRDHDTNARLMTEKRETLAGTFKRNGYRTLALMPGTWQEWPEGSFYGFDDVYGGARLQYRGPQFGWWDIPDQFAIARMDALEMNRVPRAPLFVLFPMISSHIPFTPTPPYQPDWVQVLTDQPFAEADVEQAFDRQPDWMNLGSSYADALAYCYQSLGGYLRLREDRDLVMIVLGDHQPAAAVSGEGATWNVPVHVIASRPAILDRLLGNGFRKGLTPADPAAGRMNALTRILLDAFGNPEAVERPEP